MAELTPSQRDMLSRIGFGGLEPSQIRDGRDFQALEGDGLVVFWQRGAACPPGVYGAAFSPGRWYLTAVVAAAIEVDATPLRFSSPE